MKSAKNKKYKGLFKSTLMLGVLCCVVLTQPVFAAPKSTGIDTPSTVNSLPIAVAGQQALELDADTSGANPPRPTVKFSGPLTEGNTTISTDGTISIGNAPFMIGIVNPTTGTFTSMAGIDTNGNINANTVTTVSSVSFASGKATIDTNGSINGNTITVASASFANGKATIDTSGNINGNVFNGNSYTVPGTDANGTAIQKQLYPFGGIYTTGNACDDNACRYKNPLTGGCGCPNGYSPSEFWEYVSYTPLYADNTSACFTTAHTVRVYQCY